jgi:hypothetical protein
MAHQNPNWASRPQPIKPAFFTISDDEAARALKIGFKLLTKRIVAAHRYLMPFLKQHFAGRMLHVDGFTLTVENMAQLALSDLQSRGSEISNVKTRTFAPSRPVIHAAAALSVLTQAAHSAMTRYDFSYGELIVTGQLLHQPSILAARVQWSEECRLALRKIDNPKIEEWETIQFVLQ